MTDLVHYLVRNPTEKTGLLYPTELDDPDYVGFGAFYLLGQPGARIGERYNFYAVQGERTLQTALLRRDSTSFFQAEVAGIGTFIFFAQPIRPRPPYVGKVTNNSNSVALRRLRSWQPRELDRACREHAFYFVGYSPRIA